MKYQIKDRWSDEVLFGVDVPEDCKQPACFALGKAVTAVLGAEKTVVQKEAA